MKILFSLFFGVLTSMSAIVSVGSTASVVFAQELKLESSQTSSGSVQQGRVQLDSDTNESASVSTNKTEPNSTNNGNAETTFKVHEGEKADGDPDRPVIVGDVPNPEDRQTETEALDKQDQQQESSAKDSKEKGGTTDINIGVGELNESQYNETNLDFISERASEVSVSAVEVRGWDPKKKAKILATSKIHTQVQSTIDLEHFTTRLVLENQDIESVMVKAATVAMERKIQAKFLGIFNSSLKQKTTVTFGDGEHGRVKVKFPWYRFFFGVESRFHADQQGRILQPEINDEVLIGFESGDVTPAVQAKVINIIYTNY